MKKLILSCSLLALTTPAYAALDCAPLPDCEDFGYAYTDDDCAGQATLKCPFDRTKLYCTEPSSSVPCTIGAILYNDLKCYNTAPEGKTAIAVVFDINKKLAIGLEQKNYISWGGLGTDISGLDNCTRSNYMSCGTDGKSNTQKIISALGESSDYAAGYCYNLTIGKLMKGSWFLPSLSELKTWYDNKTAVNAGLTKVGGESGLATWYWSSTEFDESFIFRLHLGNGSEDLITKFENAYSNDLYARCAVRY